MIPLGPLAAALVPAAASAGMAALLAAVTMRHEVHPTRAQILASLATGLGAAIGFYLVLGTAALHPRQATDRIGLCLLLLLAYSVAEISLIRRSPVRLVLRIVAVSAAATMLLLPLVQNSWTAPASAACIGGASVIVVALWESHDACARRGDSAIFAAILLLIVTSMSVITLFGGSAKLAQLAGSGVSAFGGLAVLTWANPKRFPITASVAVIWPISALIALLGAAYSDTRGFALGLALSACIAPWLLRIPALAKCAGWQRLATCAATAAALLGPAIFLAYRAYSATASEYGY